MEKQIKTNGAVIGAQKSSYKYIYIYIFIIIQLKNSGCISFIQAIFSD